MEDETWKEFKRSLSLALLWFIAFCIAVEILIKIVTN